MDVRWMLGMWVLVGCGAPKADCADCVDDTADGITGPGTGTGTGSTPGDGVDPGLAVSYKIELGIGWDGTAAVDARYLDATTPPLILLSLHDDDGIELCERTVAFAGLPDTDGFAVEAGHAAGWTVALAGADGDCTAAGGDFATGDPLAGLHLGVSVIPDLGGDVGVALWHDGPGGGMVRVPGVAIVFEDGAIVTEGSFTQYRTLEEVWSDGVLAPAYFTTTAGNPLRPITDLVEVAEPPTDTGPDVGDPAQTFRAADVLVVGGMPWDPASEEAFTASFLDEPLPPHVELHVYDDRSRWVCTTRLERPGPASTRSDLADRYDQVAALELDRSHVTEDGCAELGGWFATGAWLDGVTVALTIGPALDPVAASFTDLGYYSDYVGVNAVVRVRDAETWVPALGRAGTLEGDRVVADRGDLVELDDAAVIADPPRAYYELRAPAVLVDFDALR